MLHPCCFCRARRCSRPRTPCTCFAMVAEARARRSPPVLPPHSLQLYRSLPCSQMLAPPHSLHWVRSLPCSQKLAPPHSLHLLRCFPCSQMLPPPHSLHCFRCFPWSQMLRAPALLAYFSMPPVLADLPPPHSLHWLRCLPCSQILRAPALLALASHPPVLADAFPRALLAEIPSPTPTVHARPIAHPPPPSRGRFPRAGAMAFRAVGCDDPPSRAPAGTSACSSMISGVSSEIRTRRQ